MNMTAAGTGQETAGPSPADGLDSTAIRAMIPPARRRLLTALTVLAETDSTNAAMQRLDPDLQHGRVILADYQSAGRGRSHRNWHSPSGCNVYLSLGWQFGEETSRLATLSLCTAVAACRALSRLGLRGNDIQVGGAKLAGILIQAQTTGPGSLMAVVGIGVNVNMPANRAGAEDIDQPWTDIASCLDASTPPPDRKRVAAVLIDELLGAVTTFQREGFGAFTEEWNELDLLHGRRVSIVHNDRVRKGVARGVSSDGSLLVERVDENGRVRMQNFHAGDVSVRDA
jgi:BirA family biotin operon repressor/biotin-[acetyl-CoA-carboxylase] ligase